MPDQENSPISLRPATSAVGSEHKLWLDGTAQADAVLEKLDGQLRQLVADRNPRVQNRQ